MQDASLQVVYVSGAAIGPYLADLAHLRITVFREFPYLYDGSEEYEARYLQTYVNSPASIAVLVLDGGRVIGVSTGLPMVDEEAEFQQPFLQQGYDPRTLFYCAESVLLPEYRGRGLYKAFFLGRENHARQLGGFIHTTFCGVQRPAEHPLRPADYTPLDAVWRHFGYVPHPELLATAVYTPVDHGFPADGILAMGVLNQPQWVYAELDLASLEQVREHGQVRNYRDWAD